MLPLKTETSSLGSFTPLGSTSVALGGSKVVFERDSCLWRSEQSNSFYSRLAILVGRVPHSTRVKDPRLLLILDIAFLMLSKYLWWYSSQHLSSSLKKVKALSVSARWDPRRSHWCMSKSCSLTVIVEMGWVELTSARMHTVSEATASSCSSKMAYSVIKTSSSSMTSMIAKWIVLNSASCSFNLATICWAEARVWGLSA